MRGSKNTLRLQKINIALVHGEDCQLHVIKDVIISDKEEITTVKTDFEGPVKAVLSNWGDYGYILQEYDDKTLDFIINNLHFIKSEADS